MLADAMAGWVQLSRTRVPSHHKLVALCGKDSEDLESNVSFSEILGYFEHFGMRYFASFLKWQSIVNQ